MQHVWVKQQRPVLYSTAGHACPVERLRKRTDDRFVKILTLAQQPA